MIIDKPKLTDSEKQQFKAIIEKYQTLISEADRIGDTVQSELYFKQSVEQHEALKQKIRQRYVLSFCGRKEAVIDDIREILSAVTKEDFETEQDERRALFVHDIAQAGGKVIEKLTRKNYKNFVMFLFKVTALQEAAISYMSEQTVGVPSETEQKLYDTYIDMIMEKASSCYRKPKNFVQPKLENTLSSGHTGNFILQNKAINAFSHISNRSFTDADSFTGTGTAVQEDVEITIDDLGNSNFSVSTHKVLDFMLEHLADRLPRGSSANQENIAYSREVILTVREVAERFGTGMKEARRILNEAVNTIYGTSVKWKEKSYYTPDGKKRKIPEVMEYEHRYLSRKGTVSDETPVVNGKVKVIFDYDLTFLLSKSGHVMFYHPNLYHINSNINRHGYYLGRKMCEHYNSIVRDFETESHEENAQIHTKNANRLSVRNLIKVCPDLPSYDEVMETDRTVRRRIIEPFEKDMYALAEKYGILKTWRYCNKKGVPLTDGQWQNLNYRDWIELYIEFEIADYPDQTKRLERRASQIRSAETKKPQ